jgi:vacuolar-type H+-ATPase subunit F/Vma7
MRIVAVGRAVDVRGFALAGVETRRCESAAEAHATLLQVADERPAPGLVVVSPWVGTIAPRAIAKIRSAATRPPVVVVLPADPEVHR